MRREKPSCSHTSPSELKDLHFVSLGFYWRGWGGKGFFSVLYKNKVYSRFIFYRDCKRCKRVPLAPVVDALSNGGRGELYGVLGMSCSIPQNTEACLQHTKASSRSMTHLPHRSVPVYKWFLPLRVTWQFQPTENSLFVNWRFLLCLTELKFRSLCLISETKGNNTPIQK